MGPSVGPCRHGMVTTPGAVGHRPRRSAGPLDDVGRVVDARDVHREVLALHALHGPWLNAKLGDPRGRLSSLIESGASDREIVATLYAVALGRAPSAVEASHWAAAIGSASGRREALQDFLWALLNSSEFVSNH